MSIIHKTSKSYTESNHDGKTLRITQKGGNNSHVTLKNIK